MKFNAPLKKWIRSVLVWRFSFSLSSLPVRVFVRVFFRVSVRASGQNLFEQIRLRGETEVPVGSTHCRSCRHHMIRVNRRGSPLDDISTIRISFTKQCSELLSQKVQPNVWENVETMRRRCTSVPVWKAPFRAFDLCTDCIRSAQPVLKF